MPGQTGADRRRRARSNAARRIRQCSARGEAHLSPLRRAPALEHSRRDRRIPRPALAGSLTTGSNAAPAVHREQGHRHCPLSSVAEYAADQAQAAPLAAGCSGHSRRRREIMMTRVQLAVAFPFGLPQRTSKSASLQARHEPRHEYMLPPEENVRVFAARLSSRETAAPP